MKKGTRVRLIDGGQEGEVLGSIKFSGVDKIIIVIFDNGYQQTYWSWQFEKWFEVLKED